MSQTKNEFRSKKFGLLSLLLLVSLYILFPFLDAIIIGIAAAYLLRVAHTILNSRINNDPLSTALITGGVVGAILSGFYFFLNNFILIISTLNQITGTIRESVIEFVEIFQLSPGFEQNVIGMVDTVSSYLTDWLITSFTSIPSVLIDVGIFLFTAIYLYRDGGKIKSQIDNTIESLPEAEGRLLNTLIEEIDSIFRGVFVTQFAVAFIIFLITAIGFYSISYVASPISFIPFWSLLIATAALLPIIAGFMVYAPLAAFYIVAGQPVTGSLIMIYGVLVINVLPEIFFRPYIGSKRLDEHPLLVFIGFIAGPLTLGVKGIVIGPIILILTKRFLLNYSELAS